MAITGWLFCDESVKDEPLVLQCSVDHLSFNRHMHEETPFGRQARKFEKAPASPELRKVFEWPPKRCLLM
jgi:hypothetical protein